MHFQLPLRAAGRSRFIPENPPNVCTNRVVNIAINLEDRPYLKVEAEANHVSQQDRFQDK